MMVSMLYMISLCIAVLVDLLCIFEGLCIVTLPKIAFNPAHISENEF